MVRLVCGNVNNMQNQRSKRIFITVNRRHLLIVVGAFFILNIIQSDTVSARSNLMLSEGNKTNALQEAQVKIDELKETKIVRQDDLNKKLETIEKAEVEVTKLEKTKVQLKQELESSNAEIISLKAKLKEKKERTVPEGRTASGAAGNNYVPGNCTWYVKQKRPDIGNDWGNANMWYVSAQAAGFKTGTMAKKGAIGVSLEGSLGHVVYVEEWLGNGRLIISEMNYGGLYNRNTREVNESDFLYIYEL